MKHHIHKLIVAGAAMLLAVSSQAARVEIEWEDPEQFSDIDAGSGGQRQFEERVVEELSDHFERAAASHLPPDQTLRLTIQDVDLAGDVEYFFSNFDNQGIRVIRDIYFPSIEFSYALLNQDGVLIESGQQNVKDIGFHYAGVDHLDSAPLEYEKDLIDSWFEEAF